MKGLEAVTDEAYRALWELLLDFDLTRRVAAVTRPADEPLRWMLADPRAMRVTRQVPGLRDRRGRHVPGERGNVAAVGQRRPGFV